MLVTKNKVMASGPKAVDFINLSLLSKAHPAGKRSPSIYDT